MDWENSPEFTSSQWEIIANLEREHGREDEVDEEVSYHGKFLTIVHVIFFFFHRGPHLPLRTLCT